MYIPEQHVIMKIESPINPWIAATIHELGLHVALPNVARCATVVCVHA